MNDLEAAKALLLRIEDVLLYEVELIVRSGNRMTLDELQEHVGWPEEWRKERYDERG